MNGYAGKILRIDLNRLDVIEEHLESKILVKVLGGLGLAVKYLYDEVGPDTDALNPNNLIIFANGPLSGTGSAASGRTEVVTKSPLTGSIGTGNFGGSWGINLKRSGYDAVVIKGESSKPVFLWINDGKVEIREALDLWGLDAWETTDILKKRLGEDIHVVTIGQAGERLVKFACPVADYDHAPGRSHAGCVMGAKKLKAIAVRGTGKVTIARQEDFLKAVEETQIRIAMYPERGLRQLIGSTYINKGAAERGMLSGRNFQSTVVSPNSEIWKLPDSVKEKTKIGSGFGTDCKMAPHYGCNLVPDLTKVDTFHHELGGIYLSFDGWGWGTSCGIEKFLDMWKCRELCQRYGVDFTGPIPFAMELYQRGIITKDDTDGLDLTWGNESAVMELLKKIAYRDGIGDVLAEGSAIAAKKIGKGAEKYTVLIKNKELQYYDPRTGNYDKNLGMIVAPRGDDLNTTHGLVWGRPGWSVSAGWSEEKYLKWFIDWLDMFADVKEKIFGSPPRVEAIQSRSTVGKAAITKWFGEITSVFNSIDTCLFAGNTYTAIGPTHFSKLYSACTGYNLTPREIMKAGERIYNMMRAFSVREGFSRADDDWPSRLYDEPIADGPLKGTKLSREDVTKMLDEYYDLMGWDKRTGLQTKRKLIELELQDVANDLEARDLLA